MNTKKRNENWTAEDKNLLQELVKERVLVLENKNTDTNTNARKVAAWANLSESFNIMRNGAMRTVSQLKTQWGNIKATEKKKISIQRRLISKTGGGPPPQEDPVEANNIKAWLPLEFEIDSNEFDSDTVNQIPIAITEVPQVPHQQAVQPVEQQEVEPQEEESQAIPPEEAQPEVVQTVAHHSATIVLNQQPSSSGLGAKKKKNSKPSAQLAADIAAVEIRCREELHEIQMENERQIRSILKLKEELILNKIEYFKKKKR